MTSLACVYYFNIIFILKLNVVFWGLLMHECMQVCLSYVENNFGVEKNVLFSEYKTEAWIMSLTQV